MNLTVVPVEVKGDDFCSTLDREQEDLWSCQVSKLKTNTPTAQGVAYICTEDDARISVDIRGGQRLHLDASLDDPRLPLRRDPGLNKLRRIGDRLAYFLSKFKTLAFDTSQSQIACFGPLLDIGEQQPGQQQ